MLRSLRGQDHQRSAPDNDYHRSPHPRDRFPRIETVHADRCWHVLLVIEPRNHCAARAPLYFHLRLESLLLSFEPGVERIQRTSADREFRSKRSLSSRDPLPGGDQRPVFTKSSKFVGPACLLFDLSLPERALSRLVLRPRRCSREIESADGATAAN